MIIHLNVTQADIDAGIPKDSCKCPVALALLRHLEMVEVEVGEISGYLQGARFKAYSDIIDTFVDAFDEDKHNLLIVKPFEVELQFNEVEIDIE